MLMPVTRMGSRTNLKTTRNTAAQTAARSSVSFRLRPKIARRTHERDIGWWGGV